MHLLIYYTYKKLLLPQILHNMARHAIGVHSFTVKIFAVLAQDKIEIKLLYTPYDTKLQRLVYNTSLQTN